ncbi:MAG: transglycosylase domain-containing protein [Selenomonas sp.]|jgi:penicillin-binding protein 1A|nr:transglycosylase domain-containing protein [Selenomonas sp.]MCI7331393.1 transglycosylase domain-containing protein [Selenomonadaceae bacterium]MDD6119347.1 transglycosylase domain-containing protein [Selenomonadaceae bacterium]MDD7056452.1 transglycosylase domain-containing protein [Selenomonadaceae bacterium]MDY3915301.1 transglycosylase domain-containing protein [Selenomonadaceae bacterium]
MRKTKKRRIRNRVLRFLFTLMLVFFIAFFLSGGIWVLHPRTWQNFGDFLPQLSYEPPAIQESGEPQVMRWSDRLSRFLFIRRAVNARVQRDDYVPLSEIPDSLQQAVVAVEDNRFYSHHGFDPTGIARAALVNIQYGQIEEGASTITQQLVKNLFLSHERSWGRKGEELLLALDIEANYSKDEILELYLNTIYYGSNFYGIGPASQGYFGKKPADLILPESAMLAGLPNAPSLYSPYVDFIAAKKRQMVVLDAMAKNGYIDEQMAEDAKIKPLSFAR